MKSDTTMTTENVVGVASHDLLDSSKRLKGNWSPEVESRRIESIRRALKGKPATPEQREARAAGLRKAHAEGRIQVVRTEETTKKIADKLRGRKRPVEVVEKVRMANTGKTRSHVMRQNQSESMRQQWQEGKHGAFMRDPERRQEWLSKISEANKGRVISDEQRSKHSEKMKGHQWTPEVIESRAAPLRGRAHVKPLTAKGPKHHAAITGILRSPDNVTYPFRNMAQFVRDHEMLFLSQDTEWDEKGKCRAYKGLLGLTGKGNHVRGSWKGWTLVSYTETFYNAGDDLLDRSNS